MNIAHQLITQVRTEAVLQAGDPGVTPSGSGLPGMTQLQNLAGGVMFGGLILCVIGLVAAAAVWAVGSSSSNHHAASKGKMGVLVSVGAAIVIGGANALVKWGSGIGGTI